MNLSTPSTPSTPSRLRSTLRRVLALAVLGAACHPGALAQAIDLGTAGHYAAFVLGDASGLSKVEGKLAVGRDLDSNRLDLGLRLPADDAMQAVCEGVL